MPEPALSAPDRKRILFIAEAVTLAHVARPAVLFNAVDRTRYQPYLACDPGSHRFLDVAPEELLPIHSIPGRLFAQRLLLGRPVYDVATLQEYVDADLELIRRVRPHLIVGDFRLSLSASARLAGIPYAGITNAYWSPWASDRSLPLPVLPWTKHAPLNLLQLAFDLFGHWLLADHCEPLNRVRAQRGLAPLKADLRVIYTDADHVLYADTPKLFPTVGAPPNHHYVGPLLWSPPVALPEWWDEVSWDRPVVYVTMGSSGIADMLPLVFDALADADVTVIAASAGATVPAGGWANVRHAAYLPGTQAAARASLVICNGGSPTSQQALAAGVPVLGICSNADQLLNMRGLVRAGLGTMMRADRISRRRLRDAIAKTMRSCATLQAAQGAAQDARAFATRDVFARVLDLMMTPG